MSKVALMRVLRVFASCAFVTLAAASASAQNPVSATLALGDSLIRTNPGTTQQFDTILVTLAAGDTVDFAAVRQGTPAINPFVDVYSPSNAYLTSGWGPFDRVPATSIVPRFIAATNGVYKFVVYSCCTAGTYLVKARRSGAVLQGTPNYRYMSAAFGGPPVSDTVWIYNSGRTASTWSVAVVNSAPWLTISPSSGSLPAVSSPMTAPSRTSPGSAMNADPVAGPAQVTTFMSAAEAPAGSVPVVFTINPGALAVAWYHADVQFSIADNWAGAQRINTYMNVHSANATTLARTPGYTSAASGTSSGLLYKMMSDLEGFNTTTGQRSLVRAAASPSFNGSTAVWPADGSIFYADGSNLKRIIGTAAPVTVFTASAFIADLAVGPAGIYVATSTMISRHVPGGATTTVLTGTALRGIGYNPFDGKLYFAEGTAIRRLNIAGNFIESFTTTVGSASDIAFGRSGNVYARMPYFTPDIYIFSSSGTLITTQASPLWGYDIVMAEGALLTTGNLDGVRGRIQRNMVSDGPPNTLNVLALGDSLLRTAGGGLSDTVTIALQAGDVIDIAALAASGSGARPNLHLLSPSGSFLSSGFCCRRGFPNGSAIFRFTIATTGAHRIVTQNYSAVGPYMVKARRFGQAVESFLSSRIISAPVDGVGADTMWIFNRGTTSTNWTSTIVGTAPWLSLSPSSGTLPGTTSQTFAAPAAAGGAQQLPGRTNAIEVFTSSALAPAGSVPIIVSVNAAGRSMGSVSALITYAVPDTWGGSASTSITMAVHDPAASAVARIGRFSSSLAVEPSGSLLFRESGTLSRFNTSTNARTTVNLNSMCCSPGGVAISPLDGTVYVGERNTIQTRAPGANTGPTVFTAPTSSGEWFYDLVATHSSVYGVNRVGLFRLDYNGAASTIATGTSLFGLGHNPADGQIYFGENGVIKRYNPSTGAITTFATVSGGMGTMVFGRSGNVYMRREFSDEIVIINSAGTVLGTTRLPYYGVGLAILEGALWATGYDDGMDGRMMRLAISDGPAAPTRMLAAAGSINLRGAAGQTVTDSIRVTTTDNAAVGVRVTKSAPWLTVTPDSSTTGFNLRVSANLTGFPPGFIVTDTIKLTSSGIVNSPLAVVVTAGVLNNFIALGDTVATTISVGAERDTFTVALQANDTIDIGMFHTGTGSFDAYIDLLNSAGAVVAFNDDFFPRGTLNAILNRFVVAASGNYRIVARTLGTTQTGAYTLKVRRSGGIIAAQGSGRPLAVRAGSTSAVTDTIFLGNYGARSASWRILGSLPSWLTLTPLTGTLNPMPAPPAVSGPKADLADGLEGAPLTVPAMGPPGTTAVVMTVTATDPAQGTFSGSVNFELIGDTWAGPHSYNVFVSVFDSRIEIVANRGNKSFAGAEQTAPDELMVGALPNLERWNLSTGSSVVAAAGATNGQPATMMCDPDRTCYIGDFAATVKKVTPAGVVSTLFTAPEAVRGLAKLPDGTIYASTFNGIWRLPVTGTPAQIHTAGSIRGLGYQPQQQLIYFSEGNNLRTYNPQTGAFATVANMGRGLYDLRFGSSGKIYGRSSAGIRDLITLSPTGLPIDSARTPSGWDYGFSMGPGALWATSYRGYVVRMPISDTPMRAGPQIRLAVVAADTTLSKGQARPVRLRAIMDGTRIAAADGRIHFRSAVVLVDSVTAGSLGGMLEANLAMQGDSGFVRFAMTQPTPPNRDTVDIAIAWVRARTGAVVADTATMYVHLSSLNGEAPTLADLLPGIVENHMLIVAVQSGVWGDTDFTWRDAPTLPSLSSRDALVCLLHIVGQSVVPNDPTACDVAPDSGVIFNGTITALDALVILSRVVGRDVSQYRVGRGR